MAIKGILMRYHNLISPEGRNRPGRIIPPQQILPDHLNPIPGQPLLQLPNLLMHHLITRNPTKLHNSIHPLYLLPYLHPLIHRLRCFLRLLILTGQHKLHSHHLPLLTRHHRCGHLNLLPSLHLLLLGDHRCCHCNLLRFHVLWVAQSAYVVC